MQATGADTRAEDAVAQRATLKTTIAAGRTAPLTHALLPASQLSLSFSGLLLLIRP
jgi:hypothetical protein